MTITPLSQMKKLALTLALAAPASVYAHPIHTPHGTISEGFLHTLTSWEHMIIAFSLGLLLKVIVDTCHTSIGKALGAFASFYVLTHFTQVTSGATLIGLAASFGALNLLGVVAGKAIQQPSMQAIRIGTTVSSIALLTLLW
jgi:hypothetical protein